MSEWNEAKPEVIEMARRIIAEDHIELRRSNIAFVMKSDGTDSQGSRKRRKTPFKTWAQAAKIPAKYDALMDFEFLIWIQEEIWDQLSHEQREALIDHELCHCGYNENDVPTMIPHDFEEFSCVIERHGLWRKSLLEMGKAAEKYIQQEAKFDKADIEIAAGGRVSSLTGAQLKQMANQNAL
jgi:NADH:ubiquinone oxidoreductase subunit